MGVSIGSLEFDRCLDVIVELTRAKDPQELAEKLLVLLREVVHADSVRLLAIANDNHDAEFHDGNVVGAFVYDVLETEVGHNAPTALAADASLLACVLAKTAITTPDGKRLIYPILGDRHACSLLLVENARHHDALAGVVPKILHVYRNQLVTLSRTQIDPLTGLFNRQSFYDRIRRLTLGGAGQRRSDSANSVGNCFALIDIDFFKQVNDKFGHIYGDEVLLLLSRVMMRSFRHDDLLFRYGGEEFAAVLANVDLENAKQMLERFRRAVETYNFPRLEPKTVSIGITRINIAQGVDKVVMCADKALYFAKNHGRNQVCCYEDLVAEGKLEPVTVAEGDIELF